MKQIKYTLLLILALLCSCTQEDNLSTEKGAPLELEITAEDFRPSEETQTRITEEEAGRYTTKFSTGDAIGITVLQGEKIVDGMDNIPYTYNGTAWTTAAGKKIYCYDNVTYIAYYPYSATMNGKKKIEDIVAAFTPKADQSDYTTGYSQSCLMTAVGTPNANTKKLSFTFELQMTMLELQFKQILNATAATAVAADEGSVLTITSNTQIYTFNVQDTDKRYRMLLKPGASFDINFTYSVGGVSYTYTQGKTAMPATAGKYVHYDLKHVQSSRKMTLNTGNYAGELGPVTKVKMDHASGKVTSTTGNTHTCTVVAPGGIFPSSIKELGIYIKDNLADSEQLLVTTKNFTADMAVATVTVTLSRGGMEGAGTSESDPYLVTTPPQLRGVAVEGSGDNNNPETRYYEQASNLDLSMYPDWKPVKSGKNYDGKHYGISNLTSSQGGIFSHNGGTIQNVHLVSGSINCTKIYAIGGIINVSQLDGGKIMNCSNAVDIKGDDDAAGIVGDILNGTVSHCKNTGNITCIPRPSTADECNCGGIVAEDHESNVLIEYCYNTGNINGAFRSGGIVNLASGNSKVKYCYSRGTVSTTASQSYGHIVAEMKEATTTYVTDCRSDNLPFAKGQNTVVKGVCDYFSTQTGRWPQYTSMTGDGWTSTHWQYFNIPEYPKLIWEDQVKFTTPSNK